MSDLRAYTVKAAAELMGITPRQVYRLIEEGQIDYFTIGLKGGGKRIRAAEIERWQKSGGTSPMSETASSSACAKTPKEPASLSTVGAKAITAALSASASRPEASRPLERNSTSGLRAITPSGANKPPIQ